MPNKEKLTELKSEMDLIISEREQLLNTTIREDNVISLNVESAIKIKGLELKMNSLREKIGGLSQIIAREERESYGFTVFGMTTDENIKS